MDPIYRSRELAVPARPVTHRHTHTPSLVLVSSSTLKHTLSLSTHNFDRCAFTTLDCRLAWMKFLPPAASLASHQSAALSKTVLGLEGNWLCMLVIHHQVITLVLSLLLENQTMSYKWLKAAQSCRNQCYSIDVQQQCLHAYV